jgi:glycosyltransferase involved in cell wall biosynthesis
MINLLYLPCHQSLEFDELRLFSDMPNVTAMSPGSYWKPSKGCRLRPGLDLDVPASWVKQWNMMPVPPGQDHKNHISEEAVEPFDVIVVMHQYQYILNNLDVFKGKHVIWRDIGQAPPCHEVKYLKQLKDHGVKIVRYWEGFQGREHYQGHDAIIPFGKYQEDFEPWSGSLLKVAAIANNFRTRAKVCRKKCWDIATHKVSRRLYGKGNAGIDGNAGCPKYADLIRALSDHRSFWYGGTCPAPYTLGLMEAMFTGVPVFSVKAPGWETALPGLLGADQLCDDSHQLNDLLKRSLGDDVEWLQQISDKQVQTARDVFGADKVRSQWQELLSSL